MSSFLVDYTKLDELGQGGFAKVYKVRHNKLGYIRAIRVLNEFIANGEQDSIYQRFLEECKKEVREQIDVLYYIFKSDDTIK